MTGKNYQIGGALPASSPYYVTRKADEELYNYLIEGEFCYVFNARQMGKTSLQFQVSQRLKKEDYMTVHLDLNGIGNTLTVEQWYATIISKISRSLNLTFNLSSWWNQQEILSFSNRWEVFLKDILLKQIPNKIIIFIDEIDTVLNLDFSTDDFFASIRACFNNRANNDDFNRLTFCLLGVTRPYYLIENKQITPFNIGKAIELQGFTFEEAEGTLSKGLNPFFKQPKKILKQILFWTGGQPFLTVKICQLMVDSYKKLPQKIINVEEVIRENIIKNWRFNDDPIHLQVIENRIINNSHSVIELLMLYQQIIKNKVIVNQDIFLQYELRLSGLIIKNNNCLQVYNKIYSIIFNETWIAEKIETQLSTIRPDFYVTAFKEWMIFDPNKSQCFLSPQQLQEFENWASKDQELTKQDFEFLHSSVKEHERQTRKKKDRLKLIFSSFIMLLITSFIGIQWYQFNKQYQEKISENLMLTSQEIEDNKRNQKIILQLEALRRNSNLSIPLNFYRDLAKIPRNHQVFFHENQVNDIAISQNGEKFLTGSLDGNAYLWNRNGKLIHKLSHNNYNINAVAFSGDNNYFATASIDGTVKVWHQNGKLKLTFKHRSSVNAIAFSPDHNYLATVGADHQIKLLHLSTKNRTSLVHGGNILSLAFSPTDPYLVTGSLNKTAKLWNFITGETIKIIDHQKGVNKVIFSPNGKLMITASSDGMVKVINLDTQENYQIQHANQVLDIAVSHDNKRLVTVSKNVARLWSIKDIIKSPNQTFKEKNADQIFKHNNSINKAIFTPNNQHLITVDDGSAGKVWNLNSNNSLSGQIFHDAPIVDVEVLNNQTIITASWDNTVRFWKISPNNEIKITSFSSEIENFSFILEIENLAILDKNNQVKILDFTNQRIVDTGINEGKSKQQIILSSQGNYLGIIENEIVKIWRKNNDNLWKLITTLPHFDAVHYLQFSPDENYLVTASDDWKTRLWVLKPDINFDNGNIIFKNYVDSLSFSPDSNFLAITSQNKKSAIFDIEKSVDKEVPSEIIEFSPGGNYLITYNDDQLCLHYHISFKQIKCLFFDNVNKIEWSESEEYLMTTNDNNQLSILKISHIKKMNQYNFKVINKVSFENEIKNFKISPNGKYLAIVTKDNNIYITSIVQPSKISLHIESNNDIKGIELGKKGKDSLLTVITSKDILQFPLWDRKTLLKEKACDLLTQNLTSRQWENFIDKHSYYPTCRWDSTINN